MIELALTIAVSAAAVILLLRSTRRHFLERGRPGRTAASAIGVEDYSDIDAAVRMEVCACKSHFVLRGEGPLQHRDRQLRVARIECRGCGRERVLYFDITTLPHPRSGRGA